MTWYAVGRSQQRLSATEWFHGSSTYEPFDRFDFDKYKGGAGSDEPGAFRHWNSHLGAHFTSEHHTAVNLADMHGGMIYHCSLAMQNPKHYGSEHNMTVDAHRWARGQGVLDWDHTAPQHRQRWDNDDLESDLQNHHELVHGWKKHLQDQGHDGITYGNMYEGTRGHTCAIAFHPDDITIERKHEVGLGCKESVRCDECGHAEPKEKVGQYCECGSGIFEADGPDEEGKVASLTRHFAAGDEDPKEHLKWLLKELGRPRWPEKTPEEQAKDEADRQQRVQQHEEWQTKRKGYSPGDDLSDWQGYPHAEWVPIELAQRFRDHHGDQNPGYSGPIIDDLTKQLQAGRGMTDPLMLLHHNEENVAHLGEGNHRLKAAEHAGWTHVPMRVVRMYDREVHDTDHMGRPYRSIPESWQGSHEGRTPDMCRPSDVFSPQALGQPRKQSAKEPWGTYQGEGRPCVMCGVRKGETSVAGMRKSNDSDEEFRIGDSVCDTCYHGWWPDTKANTPGLYGDERWLNYVHHEPFTPVRQSLNSKESYAGEGRGGSHGTEEGLQRRSGVDQRGDRAGGPGARPGRLRAHLPRRDAAASGGGGKGGQAPLTVEFHHRVEKDLKSLDKSMRKKALQRIEEIANHDTQGHQTHALTLNMKGWYATKISRGHRVIHRTEGNTLHVGYVGLHEYGEAIQRLTSREDLTMHNVEHPAEPDDPSVRGIKAMHKGEEVGHLHWHEDYSEVSPDAQPGTVSFIYVKPEYRRTGVGTAMWNHAKTLDPRIRHSEWQSDAGRLWAERTSMVTH